MWDAVTLEDFGKQDAEGQIHVIMRVVDLKEVQCARHELASGNQSGQELSHQGVIGLCCGVVALDGEVPMHLKAIPLRHLCHMVQCPGEDFTEIHRSPIIQSYQQYHRKTTATA